MESQNSSLFMKKPFYSESFREAAGQITKAKIITATR